MKEIKTLVAALKVEYHGEILLSPDYAEILELKELPRFLDFLLSEGAFCNNIMGTKDICCPELENENLGEDETPECWGKADRCKPYLELKSLKEAVENRR